MYLETCKSCGGELERQGNHYVCRFCGNKWMIDADSDVHVIDRANAWAALRDCDFEKSAELFENIIFKEPENHEAYWGRALAKASIIYVTDLDERKRVPTCNNISEDSFIESSDVKKAISLAPAEIADGYKEQADKIEKIRVEWLEKARKEPPYDVFISFKDSDRERGITRTQDSIDAQDLYNMLTSAGLKVFFSRISLLDKVSEKYEPYIYNAIKTAKVMIVFGERPEYFSAVWIKNEWSRFIKRIEAGEKHQNSLIIVYKDLNPGDLPTSLSSRQCVNYADMPAVVEMLNHVKRVVAAAKKTVTVDRIDITGGEMSTKASAIQNETITTQELGQGTTAETNISEDNKFKLVERFIGIESWDDAHKQLEAILLDHPKNPDALFLGLMIKHKVKDKKALISNARLFDEYDLSTIKTILDNASKDFSIDLLDRLYCLRGTINEKQFIAILKLILPYNCPTRAHHIFGCFNTAIAYGYYNLFTLLISTLKSDEVDKYIHYYTQYALQTNNIGEKIECAEKILAVNPGNSDALRIQFDVKWENSSSEQLIACFEEILKYSSDIDEKVKWVLSKPIKYTDQCTFLKEALRYYKGDYAALSDTLLSVVDRMIHGGFFAQAQYFVEQAIALGCDNPKVYWQLCLIKIGVRGDSEAEILASDIPLKSLPEYNKYLSLVSDKRFNECVALANGQESAIKSRIEERKRRQEESIRLENERIAREKQHKKDIDTAIRMITSTKSAPQKRGCGWWFFYILSWFAPTIYCFAVVGMGLFSDSISLHYIISRVILVTISITIALSILLRIYIPKSRLNKALKLKNKNKYFEALNILLTSNCTKAGHQLAASIWDNAMDQKYGNNSNNLTPISFASAFISRKQTEAANSQKHKNLEAMLWATTIPYHVFFFLAMIIEYGNMNGVGAISAAIFFPIYIIISIIYFSSHKK